MPSVIAQSMTPRWRQYAWALVSLGWLAYAAAMLHRSGATKLGAGAIALVILLTLAAGVLHFSVRWQHGKSGRALATAVGFAAAAILTKGNAYAWALLPVTLLG